MIEQEQRASHWRGTVAWGLLVLGAVVLVALVAPLYTEAFNRIIVLGFPLGFFLAAQGALMTLVALVFWFAARQERIDRRHGASEES